MRLKLPPLYLSAPVDEVALAAQVAPLVQGLGGELPDAAFFQGLAAREGMDVATMALYLAIREAKENAGFIAEIESLPAAPDSSDCGQAVVVVPALFYSEHPEVGADGQLALDVARRMGFKGVRAPTGSMGSLSRNADRLRDFLGSMAPQPVWLVSLSRGTGEVRLFFDRHCGDPLLAHIRGWVNVCGLVGGTPIHDFRASSAWKRLKYRVLVALLGGEFRNFLEYDTSHPHWQRPIAVPEHVRVVNAVAIPLPCHMQTHLIGRYRSLAALGPNDGMIACRTAVLPGGVTYPLWGSDHFFRGADVSTFLYRLFHWIRVQSASPRAQRLGEAHAP
jgi:hypothetical protein